MRIFASDKVELAKLDDTIEQKFHGKWGDTTAGGRRHAIAGGENQRWCTNPQYFLNITSPTHIKIILRRKKVGKRTKQPIGITVTKANSPVEKPSADMVKPGKNGELPEGAITHAPKLENSMA